MRTTANALRLLCVALLLGASSGCGDGMNLEIAPQARSGGAPTYNDSDPLGDDDDAAGDDDDDTSGASYAELATIDPLPGTATHHYRRPLRIGFTGSATGASFAVFAAGGAPVQLEVSWNADRTACWLSAAFAPATTYTVDFELYSQGQSWTFSTSDVGLLEAPPSSLDGGTWVLDLAGARIVAPAGLDALLAGAQLGGSPALQAGFVDAPEYDHFNVRTGLVTGGGAWEQDTCSGADTIAVSGGFVREEALFAASGQSMDITLGSSRLTLEDAWIEGDFAPDGQALVGVDLSGWLRASSLDELAGGQDGCALLVELVGGSCATCPDGVEDCVWVAIEDIAGTRAGLDIDVIDPATLDSCSGAPTELIGCSAVGRSGAPQAAWALLFGALLLGSVRRRHA